jgi:predicted enzyme related to lactoylglutathione lyase
MKNVTGVGGVFIKAKDPQALAQWYTENLGVEFSSGNHVRFKWNEEKESGVSGSTVLSFLNEDSEYFNPSSSKFMLNVRVKNLHKLLSELKNKGVWIADKTRYFEYGSFGWIMDPEGNKIELWEPKDEAL